MDDVNNSNAPKWDTLKPNQDSNSNTNTDNNNKAMKMKSIFRSVRSSTKKRSMSSPPEVCEATVESESRGEKIVSELSEDSSSSNNMRISNMRAVSSAFRKNTGSSHSTPRTVASLEDEETENRDENTSNNNNNKPDECSASSCVVLQPSMKPVRSSLGGLPLAGSSTCQVEKSFVSPTSSNTKTASDDDSSLAKERSSTFDTAPSEEDGSTTQGEEDEENVAPQQQQPKKKVQWCKVSPTTFTVRSHNYRKTQIKVPSPGELYECVGVDFLECSKRLPEMSSRVELSHLLPNNNHNNIANEIKTWHAPDLFVITVSLPTDVSDNKAGDDGPCYTVTMYYRMTEETREILKRITSSPDEVAAKANESSPQVNAIRLFNEWCQKAPTDPSWQSRFKFLPGITNIHELGIPNWIGKYSGKPVLIKRCGKTGFLYSHKQIPNVMEMEVSLHPFPWMAKKAIAHLFQSGASKALTVFGFVIEGRDEEQLPEVLIGLVQLPYLDNNAMIRSEDFFHNPRVRTRSLHVGVIPPEDEDNAQ